MQERVASILSKVTGIKSDFLTPDLDLINDLGLSSLDVISLMVMFEEEFGIEIPDKHIFDFSTVGDIVRYLQE
jgi:acyl carrier protein